MEKVKLQAALDTEHLQTKVCFASCSMLQHLNTVMISYATLYVHTYVMMLCSDPDSSKCMCTAP